MLHIILIYSHKIGLPFYLNHDRSFYHLLGLKRHILLINVHNICLYATQYLETGILPKRFAGDDTFHEGGDFIISTSGKVEYAYVAEARTRPPVSDILHCLQELHSSN